MVLVPPVYDDIELLDRAKALLAPAGFGHISVTTAENHDAMIAFTSQLAHVVSNAYVKSPTAGLHIGFSAGSYKDMTRVAWLNPGMWAELFLENKDYLIDELDWLIGSLNEYRAAMVANDGSRTNEERFWEVFDAQFETPASENYKHFLEFYEQGFAGARKATGFNPRAAETVRELKAAGYRVALATNPLFPRIATEQRIRWAGLEPEDFELYTTYENSRTCKPNPQYYVEVAESLGVRPQDCIMIMMESTEPAWPENIGRPVFSLTTLPISISLSQVMSFRSAMVYPAFSR
jgi:phosphoglycolate phosphatase-like HAD superfamily hydrolase